MKARLAGVSLAGVWRNQLAGSRSLAEEHVARDVAAARVLRRDRRLTKPNSLFLMTGKPAVKPNWLRRLTGLTTPGLKTLLVAFSALFWLNQ